MQSIDIQTEQNPPQWQGFNFFNNKKEGCSFSVMQSS